MSHALATRKQHKLQVSTGCRHALCLLASAALFLGVLGCNSTPVHTTSAITTAQTPSQYPPRTTAPPPPFKLFHRSDNGSFTLVTTPTATDEQIEAIVWQLRDAAYAHAFDKVGIPQKLVNDRNPMVWFHIYRGSRCAAEKYTEGKLPCGPSYHAAGDYTFGGGAHNDWDSGVILHDENHQTDLWDPGSPYLPPSQAK